MGNNKPFFSEHICKGCSLCVEACPKGLIRMAAGLNRLGYHPAGLKNEGDCNGCGLCAVMCPDVAITLEKGV